MNKRKFLLQLFFEKLALTGVVLAILMLAGMYVHGSNRAIIIWTVIACVLATLSYFVSRRINRPLPDPQNSEESEKNKETEKTHRA